MKEELFTPIDVEQQDNTLNFDQRVQDIFMLVVVRIRRINYGGNDGGDGEIEDVLCGLVSNSSSGVTVTVTDNTDL